MALAPGPPHISKRDLRPRWQHSIYAILFDSYRLKFTDIYNHPSNYLNGAVALNVTGCVNACVYELNESRSDTINCTIAEGSAQDSFMWSVAVDVSQISFVRQVRRTLLPATDGKSARTRDGERHEGQFTPWWTWLN